MAIINTVNLTFNVIGQSLIRTDRRIVASGAIQTVFVDFNFDDAWADLHKFCRFEGAGGVFDVRIQNDRCVVPWEVIEASGFKLACYGTVASDMMLTTEKAYVRVHQSVNFTGNAVLPKDETPSMIAQYEQVVRDAVAAQESNNEVQASNNAQQMMNNAKQEENNERVETMAGEVASMVTNTIAPTISSANEATNNANAAAERANNAVTDLESGLIPIIATADIDRAFTF